MQHAGVQRPVVLGVLVLIAAAGSAFAQTFPVKPIRVLDGFPPGGGTDFLSRTLAPRLTESWGQPVVIDNRPGASSNIGAELAARAAPDGYTWFMGLVSVLAPSMTLYRKLPYNLLTDFAPVTRVATGTYVLLVSTSIQAKSVQELLAIAKAKSPSLAYASSGVGSPSHLAAELFNLRAGLKLLHVAYKGGAPAAAAIASGESHLTFVSVPASMPLVNAGKARAIAVTTPQRSRGLPDVPTVAESGLPGFDVTVTYGIFVPAGTAAALIERINTEINRILQSPAVVERLAGAGLEAQGGSAAAFHRIVKEEVQLWADVVKEARLTID